ncbi:MAG: hypothetical protein DBX39_03630 [Bacillota bacterium]|nr:MAG: hypothetical protein DBX39_03630 [Bacillota bacterium]
MKKIFASVVAVILFCVSVAFFAACEKVQPNIPSDDEVTITAELSESEVTVGETVTLNYSASKGSVSVTYSKDGGASVTFTGTTFTPEEAGVYVFTFSAENAESVTKTLTVTAPEPVKPVITAELDKTQIRMVEEERLQIGTLKALSEKACERRYEELLEQFGGAVPGISDLIRVPQWYVLGRESWKQKYIQPFIEQCIRLHDRQREYFFPEQYTDN